MRLVGGMLRFAGPHVPACVTPVDTRLRAIGRASGWLACVCTIATALVASALPTPTLEELSPVPVSDLAGEILVVGSVAGLGAAWTGTPRALLATFQPGAVEAGAASPAAGGSNQTGDDGTGQLDAQLEFVTIAGITYNTGLGPDPAACGPGVGAQFCVAIYDGLLEAALAWANEARYLLD